MHSKKYIVLILLILQIMLFAQDRRQSSGGNYQPNGVVTGTIIDKKSKKPLEYCNIVIHRSKDSSLVTGGVTDADGNFRLESIPFGKFYLKISSIGFDTRTVDSVFITGKKNTFDVGKIYLVDHFYKVSDVVVTGEKEEIITNLDKKVINVDKNLAASSGSAVDVLQTVPSVSVDVNGNISLRGSQNVTVLINGRPSGLVGVSGSDILNQIPATSIESIEIVTNPSVKYDPEGTSGIINIVLKKKDDNGFNGLLSANIGTKDKYNNSVHTNYKYGKMNYFVNYDNRINSMNYTSSTQRTSFLTTPSDFLSQDGNGTFKFNANSLNVGSDYFINDFNQLSASVQLRKFKITNNQSIANAESDSALTRDFLRQSNLSRTMSSVEYALSYKKTYDEKGRELNADFSYSNNSMNGDQTNTQVNYIPVGLQSVPQRSASDNSFKMFNGQINYDQQFNQSVKLETGLKSTVKDLGMNNAYDVDVKGNWIEDPTQRNNFDYKEQVHAIYAMLTGELLDIKYQTGLRFEDVFTKGTLVDQNQTFTNDYTSFYPSIHLAKVLGEGEFALSYSRRVDRPNNRQLNPFVSYADSQNIQYGNPKLKPQYTNSYEAGYAYFAGPTSVTTTFFYRQADQVINSISSIDNNNVTRTTYENLDKFKSYGIECVTSSPITAWWRVNGNASYFNTAYNSAIIGTNSSKSNTSWIAKLNSMFTLWGNTQLQIMLNYNSPVYMPQGKNDEVFFADIACKKDFLDNNLTLSLRVSDVFHSQKYSGITNGEGFFQYTDTKRDSRVVFFGASYRLFNFDRSKEKRAEGEPTDF
jgi:outer membrane receptor protein involved in Fe transport